MSSTRSRTCSNHDRKSLIRKRPVSFGNLGTYHGFVYTNSTNHLDDHTSPIIEGAEETHNLVAMVEVPSEQVPEGILNLARCHRDFILHARIVIEQEEEMVKEIASLKNDDASSETKEEATVITDHSNNTTTTTERRSYLILFELCSADAAQTFVEDLDRVPFTSLDESVICHVHPVVALQGSGGVSLMSPFFASELKTEHGPKAAATADAFNCAVCLERMDLDPSSDTGRPSSILTTVCNHSFHIDCLLQWQDSPCPVCRYDHSGLNEALSQCHVCGTTQGNYVCLICGVVSCGDSVLGASSYMGDCQSDDALTTSQVAAAAAPPNYLDHSHARKHYDETLHAYALNTNTQHVWDFAGQGYVHRLLQNKEDGKLVEVSDPSNTTSQERSLRPGLSEAQAGEAVHRKLEGFANQYNTLLKSQLEQQRIYYESRLEEIRHEPRKQKSRAGDLIAALKQEKHHLSQRLETLQAKCRKVDEDVAFIKSLNESLESNRALYQRQIKEEQTNRIEQRKIYDSCLPPLQDKVTQLMLQLENNNDCKPAAK